MNKFKNGMSKVFKFLRRNIYYVLIVIAVATIATVLGVTLSKDKVSNDVPAIVNPVPDDGQNQDVNKPDENDDTNIVEPIIFALPVSNAEISQHYSDTEFVFSNTLNQWSTHLGIDYKADEGTPVVAVYDGVVTAIENDELYGYVVTVSHKEGLVTKYCGLTENIKVAVSDNVIRGQQVGEVGNTMLIECMDGPHLHFETLKNNKLINPNEYFIAEDK